jgi:hypothetical protein
MMADLQAILAIIAMFVSTFFLTEGLERLRNM